MRSCHVERSLTILTLDRWRVKQWREAERDKDDDYDFLYFVFIAFHLGASVGS